MRINCRFRNMARSQDLEDFAECRFSKLRRYEWKPLSVQATFCAERHECRVEVYVHGRETSIRATAQASSFFEALDCVVEKLLKQLARKKNRVQNHSSHGRWQKAG